MPLRSKRTVRIHEIATGTTEQQYLDFVEHLCTKPKTASKFHFSRVTKQFKSKSKLLVGASTSTSNDEVDEDVKSMDETKLPTPPSTLTRKEEQTAPLLNTSQPTVNGWKKTTFCFQNGHAVGTISFESELLKNEALMRHEKDKKSCWKDWIVVDNFDRITILYEGLNADFDICAVHGQGGNAIDTWTAEKGQMWLRDFLPEHEKFKNSRIMTFGYDSDVTDRSTVMELENWAETLLQSLNEVRAGDEEKKRPLLLVCHSLGGLVVRKAMAHLNPTVSLENIKLSQFGIVFLATPHSGSTIADWSNFLVATAHTIGGIRTQAVENLRSFNPASVWDTAAFLNLDPCPPFTCFAEGRMMRVKGIYQHVVTQSSATLGKRQASQIMNVDHVSICKFDSRLGPFTTISMALLQLLNDVTTGGMQQPKAPDRRMFGQPRFLAHAYPPHRGFWWEGDGLNEIQHQITSARPFFGRSREIETLQASIDTSDAFPKLTVIKGIPGIGKTELLLQFAAKQRHMRNVFFLAPQDEETIDTAISKISTRIGFDMIEDPAVNQERWRSTPVSERIQIFITWLAHTCNEDSLFIIDDIERFGYSKLPITLKYAARRTLISTRDSNFTRADRDFRELRLTPLGEDDTMKILESTINSQSAVSAFRNGLSSIASQVQGHPLAARNAIPFAMEYLATYESPGIAFSDLLQSHDFEERKIFLEFSFEGQSLWGAFDSCLERLRLEDDSSGAMRLIQILPFLRSDSECMDDLLKMDKRWLRDCEEELPDVAILNSSYGVISKWLSKLRSVSFYVWNASFDPSKSLNIHPLVLQYMLLRNDEERRNSLIRQVLLLCYKLEDKGSDRESQVKPHVLRCVQVCRGLGISLNSLDLSQGVIQWVEGFLQEQEQLSVHVDGGEAMEDPFVDPVETPSELVDEFLRLCIQAKEKLHRCSDTLPEDSTMHKMIADCAAAYKKVRGCITGHERKVHALRPNLVDCITALQDMVRLRSIYPEFLCELEDFKASLEND